MRKITSPTYLLLVSSRILLLLCSFHNILRILVYISKPTSGIIVFLAVLFELIMLLSVFTPLRYVEKNFRAYLGVISFCFLYPILRIIEEGSMFKNFNLLSDYEYVVVPILIGIIQISFSREIQSRQRQS